jgi:hypothetical protein
MGRVLVLGPPRSGSTWVAEAIAASAQVRYIHEPDSPDSQRAAIPSVIAHGLYPFIDPADTAPAYRELWDPLLDASQPGVIKSVFACLSVDWLAARYHPRVVLVQRNPLNIIASWMSLGYAPDLTISYGFTPRLVDGLLRPLGLPDPPDTGAIARTAWWIALLYAALDRGQAAHSGYLAFDHDRACLDPSARFGELLAEAGIERSRHLDEYLDTKDRPGAGHETSRVTSAQPDNWRRRLSQSDVDQAARVLDGFPTTWWSRHLDDVETRPPLIRVRKARPVGGPLSRRFALVAASLVLALGVGASNLLGSSTTGPGMPMAPTTVYAADPARDVAVPGVADAEDLSALDIFGTSAYIDGGDLVGRIDLADASAASMDTDLTIYNGSPDSVQDSDEIEYMVRFGHNGKVYFLAFEQDAAGQRRSFGGTIDSPPPSPVYSVNPTMPVSYEVVGNSLFLRAPRSAFGPAQDTSLQGLTAMSFVRGIHQPPADSVGAVDAGLRSWQSQPQVAGDGCPTGCPVPSRERAGRP